MALGRDEIVSRFGRHTTTKESKPKHDLVVAEFITMGEILDDLLPDGRDKSLVFTHLEDAAMRANRAISHVNPIVEE